MTEVFLTISGENTTKHKKSSVLLYVADLEEQNIFQYYLSGFIGLAKKIRSSGFSPFQTR